MTIRAVAEAAHLPLFEALASAVRLEIIRLLAEEPLNNKRIAEQLNLSASIVSMHVRKLQQAGLVRSVTTRKDGGTHKINMLAEDLIEIVLPKSRSTLGSMNEISIPVGHYAQFDIRPTCGMASTEKIIGQFDDPRYFYDPEHIKAGILWFGQGYVEYDIPNYTPASERVEAVEISMELASEAPGYNENWPSDIRFQLNGMELGCWTSPGDFGLGRGKYAPGWWRDDINQYGLLKVIRIDKRGSFIDGQRLSDTVLDDIPIDRTKWSLRLSVDEAARNIGGLTLFGKGFGNYNQDILFRTYSVKAKGLE